MIANKSQRTRARYAKQKVYADNTDRLVTDLSTFVQYATKGVPQYLEAMWSQHATVDYIYDFRMNFVPDLYSTEQTYIRTITNFWREGSFKKRRHAARLWCNLETMYDKHQFNPTLSDAEVDYCNLVAAGYGSLELPLDRLTDHIFIM